MTESYQYIHNLFHLQKNNDQRLTIDERIEFLKVLKETILLFENEIHHALQLDLRKHPIESGISEITPLINEINLFIKNLRQWAQIEPVKNNLWFQGSKALIKKEPWGLCLIISPWNYPIQLPLLHLISSIAAGNKTIIKPSEFAPNCSKILSEMISGCFPEEWIAVIEGGEEVGKELLSLPFHHIHFTGSPEVGKKVMSAAANHLASCTLELGGKSPLIVDDKINLDRVVKKTILGKCLNLGQTCIAPDYILIPENRKIDFLEKLSQELDKTFGEKISNHPHLSRIINHKHFHRLKEMYEDAIQSGAKVYHGGEFIEEDLFISPTILYDIPETCRIRKEEIFGPLIPVITFKTVKEAKEIILSNTKPLSLYIFSDDRRWYQYFSKHTSSGAIVINDIFTHIFHPNLPFGGANHSGLGYSTGYYGFLTFSHLKPILKANSIFSITDLMHFPYSNSLKTLMNVIKKLPKGF